MTEQKKLIFVSEVHHSSFTFSIAHYMATMNLKHIINIIVMLRNVKGLQDAWEDIKKRYPNIQANMNKMMKTLNLIDELRKSAQADSSRDKNKYDKLLVKSYSLTPSHVMEVMDAFWTLLSNTELQNVRVSQNLVELASKNELNIKNITGEQRKPYFENR